MEAENKEVKQVVDAFNVETEGTNQNMQKFIL